MKARRLAMLGVGCLLAFVGFGSAVDARAAPLPVTELDVDFELLLVKVDKEGSGLPRDTALRELRGFAERYKKAGNPAGAARALGRVALLELGVAHLAEAASAVAEARSQLPAAERPLGAQLALLDSRIAELQGRYADMFVLHARAMELAARPAKPIELPLPRNPMTAARMAAERGNAVAKVGLDYVLGLQNELAATNKPDPEYVRRYRELMVAVQRGTPSERERAAAELRTLGETRAKELERKRTRLTLEYARQKGYGAAPGFDAGLNKGLAKVVCSNRESFAAFSANGSFGTWRDQAFSMTANAKQRALSEPDVIVRRAGRPVEKVDSTTPLVVPEEFSKLRGECYRFLELGFTQGFNVRVRDPLEPESYLTTIVTQLRAQPPSTTADGYLIPAEKALAARKLARGDRAGARADWADALARAYVPNSDHGGHLDALLAFTAVATPGDRPLVLEGLKSEEAAYERQRALWEKPSPDFSLGGALAAQGVTEAEFRAAQPGDASTVSALFRNTTALTLQGMSFGATQELVTHPLGIARGHDLVGNPGEADRIRRQVAAAVDRSQGLLVRRTFDAIVNSDLAEREARAGQTGLAALHAKLAAYAWARLVPETSFVRFGAGVSTSRPPPAVFEQAVRAALALGETGQAFELAELARTLSSPSRAGTPAVQADAKELEGKLTDAEETAIRRAPAATRGRLERAVAQARADSKPRTTLVSPLAAAGARVDALREFLPRTTLAALDAELSAFESSYQTASSRAHSASRTTTAARQVADAEAALRKGDPEAAVTEQRARDEITAARAASRVSSPLTFRTFRGLAELQAKLGVGTNLVSYWFGPASLFAFVVTDSSAVGMTLPGVTRELVELQAKRTRAGDISSLQQTHAALIAPLRPQLKGRRVVLVPDGPLRAVPFEALHDGKHYLFEDFALERASFASDLLVTRGAPALVGRAFAGAASTVAEHPGLGGAQKEIDVIRRALARTQITIDPELTKVDFIEALAQHELVHVVAHGQADARQPIFSRLYLAGKSGKPAAVEAREVEGLQLGAVELVVLSACATAGAPPTANAPASAGDDPISLGDAFVKSGAKSVVATLWTVDDASATAFMGHFYPALARGSSKPAALDAARRAMLADPMYADPKQWAAFILMGDPAALAFTK